MATSRREQFTVRIDRGIGSVPAGVGFLLGKRQILTCAHVVNTALGRPARSQERPADGDLVTVRFSLLDGPADRPLRACVLSWAPPLADGLIGGDVAALNLLDEPPEGSDRARLFRGEVREQGVELYGFPGNPPRRENGAWASGTLRGRVGRGALQIDRATESALRAQPGYSGGPVIVAGGPGQGDTVAGMIVVAGKDDGSNDAYAVGIHHLSEFWSDCFTLATHPEASASARAVSTDRLRRLLEASARECELILGPQIQPHAKYAEYLEAFDQRHPHGLLGIWGKSGIFRATYVSALSSPTCWSGETRRLCGGFRTRRCPTTRSSRGRR
ncbi:serine protease [Streptomyces sp. NPDC046887]|uniref:S1 family peptidase n=1 Tax=Streptomyces sp. NPDC046887 TaxID=3155472 RepID=UPI00341161E7